MIWLILFVCVIVAFATYESPEEKRRSCEISWYGLDKYNRLKNEGKSTKPKLISESELNYYIEHGDKHQKEYFTWCRDVCYPEIRKLYKKGEV